jgi:hypothetical protein
MLTTFLLFTAFSLLFKATSAPGQTAPSEVR